ncbi:MAG: sulfatase-like hydrolase/transferase, partial [Nitrososphaera sp.]
AIHATEIKDDKPFFLYVNPLAPHEQIATPNCYLNYGFVKTVKPAPRHVGLSSGISFPGSMPPSFNEADLSDKPFRYPKLSSTHIACIDNLFHTRLESLLSVDDLIGKITTTLNNNNELAETVIVFTSDNGYMLGEHRLHGKVKVYEESIRLPLYMRLPDVGRQTIDRLVINNDLTPTFLELAGANADVEIDGRSLLPLINDPTIQWRNGFLIETTSYSAIHTDDYVYVYLKGGGREYYDLNNDPYQLQNMGGSLRWETKSALEKWRAELVICKGAACQIAEDRPAI